MAEPTGRRDDRNPTGDMDLTPLGLSRWEQAAYEALVDNPALTFVELLAVVTDAEVLRTALAGLGNQGLIEESDTPTPQYAAVAPNVALDARLAAAEHALEQARSVARDVLDRYRAHALESARNVVEVVTGGAALRQRVLQVQLAARQEIRYLDRSPYVDNAAPAQTKVDLLRRGVRCRSLYDQVALEQPGALDDLHRVRHAGGEGRVTPRVPLNLCLVDDRLGLLPLQRRAAGVEAALVVHPSGLLEALSDLFDGLWKQALPLTPAGCQPDPERRTRSGAEHARLVTLLLAGMKDEAIAHQLGIGYRTVQRQVAELMDELGASTRFQAGVQAARRDRRSRPR